MPMPLTPPVLHPPADLSIERMFTVPLFEWWQFVPCPRCHAIRGEWCRRGPIPGTQHAQREHDSRVLYYALRLLTQGI